MKYIKEDVEQMLINHLKSEAKKTEIALKIEEYEERLEYAGTVNEDTKEEVIEAMQLSYNTVSDAPRSITNKISDITAETAINYEKELNHINKEDREYLERKIDDLKAEEKRLDKEIVRVKNMLMQLSEEEEFVIKTFYMKKSKWDYVSQQYCAEFQKPKSIKQLQNIRDMALESMLEIINVGT